jgi:hypothetical protein
MSKSVNLTPPESVAKQAEKGLELRQANNRGGTKIGLARARDLKNRRNLSEDTINRMVSYFQRHEVDKQAKDFGNDDHPSNGYIAWLLWGGDEGKKWAEAKQKDLSAQE